MRIETITNQLNPTKTLIPLNPDNVIFLVLHHAEATNCTWQDINTWHKQNGWNCSGYNEFVDKDGTVYIMRGMTIGAQCQGYNSKSYGICVEGDFDVELMSELQRGALVERIKNLLPKFKNLKAIVPHSQVFATACPGKNYPLAKIISEVYNVSFQEAVKYLNENGIIKSPDYWLNNSEYRSDYVRQLIINLAEKMKG